MQRATAGVGLSDLDPAMEALLNRREERPVFLHPTWIRAWLSEFGSDCEPMFLRAGDGGVIGIAPLMRTETGVSFIGDANICDFMDVLVDPERSAEAYADLWGRLCQEDWTDLDLWGLMETSPTCEALSKLARDAGYAVEVEDEAVAPRMDLPATFDEYLASLDKKDRHELKRKMRRLYDSGAAVDLQILTSQPDVAAAMDDFLDLHTRSRQDKTDFMTEEMSVFFRRMASALAAEGVIRLFMLRINARPAAAVLCFDAGSHLYLYNSGYDPYFSGLSVGLVSKAQCIQWAIENGMKGLDFLRGNEPYKYDLGASDQQIKRLRVRRPA
ncbi:MAG TPA: GNAT family N-acetyltransferase [Dehalococcoidia bacterium]|nr:GNAT family N-acetyltransferase [Dehalococcoidia bacterium]